MEEGSTGIKSREFSNEQELFEILSHPLRRQILRLLYRYYIGTYSDLKEHVKSSPGVIYHHLQKLEKTQLIYQNDKKEYKLTEKGNQLVAYMDHAGDQNTSLVRLPFLHKLFLNFPLADMLLANPLRTTVEMGFLLILLLIIQIDFLKQLIIIGPFLIPVESSQLHYWVLEGGAFFFMVIILELSTEIQGKNENRLSFLSSTVTLPLISLLGTFFLSLTQLIYPVIPPVIFWAVILVLQIIYGYVIIHLLMRIKYISLDRAIITALVLSYLFLFISYLFE
ncbi:MAG: ArsR family transcriptional regulator [Candidatus Odinarchaeota archaeon]